MTCRFQKVHVVFNKSLVDLENCTSFVKSTCDFLNSTCEIDLLKLLARHTTDRPLSMHMSWDAVRADGARYSGELLHPVSLDTINGHGSHFQHAPWGG